jgi:N-acetylneuraminic acid mutarotase
MGRAVIEALETRQLLDGDPGADTFNAFINFQPAGAAVPSGYFADTGAVYGDRGNGFTYGWNIDNSANARDRNLVADQRLDTLTHMQKPGGAGMWELAIPNGDYNVHIAAGDQYATNSIYKLSAEGVLVVDARPTSANRFFEGTATISVSDGRLTITNASGSDNNKICYIDVTPIPEVQETTRINFQPSGAPIPAGFLADTGAAFGDRGNGLSYGWNIDNSANARDRNVVSDQRIDTFTHMQKPGGASTWELAIANGDYTVHIVSGDPTTLDSVHKIDVEGVLTVNGTPTAANRYIEGTQTVTVADGRLTVTIAAGAVNDKISYIEIASASQAVETARVNFQPGGAPIPAGFLADTGATFGDRGNGQFYGWNIDNTANARDRNVETDQRIDTFTHMQKPGGATTWEMAVANGNYSVHVVSGDPTTLDSVHRIDVEGILTVNGIPTSSHRYIEGTQVVSVADGRLTVTVASGAVNAKISYIEITPTTEVPPPQTNIINWTGGLAPSPIIRSEALKANIGGKLYGFGGFQGSLGPVFRSDVYDPATDTWARIADMKTRATHAGVAWDDRYVYIVGGYIGTGSGYTQRFGSVEARRYDTVTDTWLDLPNLQIDVAGGGAALINGKLHYFGGDDIQRHDTGVHFVLDLAAGATTWTSAAAMPDPRSHFGTVTLGGKVYAIAGQHGNDAGLTVVSTVTVYDPATDTWSIKAPEPTALSHIASSVFVHEGRIFVGGGETAHGVATSEVRVYDPATDTWEEATSLPAPRLSGVADVIDGVIYFTTGSDMTTTFKGVFA